MLLRLCRYKYGIKMVWCLFLQVHCFFGETAGLFLGETVGTYSLIKLM